MNIKSSLRQLLAESKARPGFTALYVGGVAFTVAFAMIITMIYYVHIAPVYPEYYRPTTSYCTHVEIRNSKMMMMSAISQDFVEDFVDKSDNYEFYTLNQGPVTVFFSVPGGDEIRANIRYTDAAFFKLYGYEFLAGHALSEADVESGLHKAVISDKVAKRIFGNVDDAVGREVLVDYAPATVVGVFREGSPLCLDSYTQVVMPLSLIPVSPPGSEPYRNYLGSYSLSLKFKDKAQADLFKADVDELMRRATVADTSGYKLSMKLQSHTEKIISGDDDEGGMESGIKMLLLMALVLLIIPSINISGMIGSQMERRLAEIGIRRSFGATRRELTRQVMFENFVLTLVGGIIGLVVAWLIVVSCRQWILYLIMSTWVVDNIGVATDIELTGEMLFAPAIFVVMLFICLVLNLLSAYIPVKLSLRRPVVSSINQKR